MSGEARPFGKQLTYIELLETQELNVGMILVPDGLGGVHWVLSTMAVDWLITSVIDALDSPYSPVVDELVQVDRAAGDVSIVLPAPSAANRGQKIGVKVKDSTPNPDLVTVSVAGGGTIDGEPAYYLWVDDQWAIFVSDGVGNWISLSPSVGAGSGVRALYLDFSSADGSHNISAPLPAGCKITQISVNVLVAFDGLSPTLDIGDAGDADRYVPNAFIDLPTADIYGPTPIVIELAADTQFLATLAKGGSTAGRCLIIVEFASDNALGVSAGGGQFVQEMHKVTASDVANGYFTLANQPADKQCVCVTVVGGARQVSKQCVGVTGVTPDFDVLDVTTKQVHINNNGGAGGLSGDIVADDILIVDYHK